MNIFVEVVKDKVKLQFFVVFMSFFIDLNSENKYFIKVFLVFIPLLVLVDQIESDDLLLVLEKAIIKLSVQMPQLFRLEHWKST